MKKTLALFMVTIMAVSLSACGNAKKETLKVYNAGAYIDKGTINDFEREYGVKVTYDEYNTPEDGYIKIAKSDTLYDVVVESEYIVDRMIQEGLLAKIDSDKLTNFRELGEEYLSPDYDPKNDYSIPYMVGTVGILYNKTKVSEPPTSWGILWDEQYKGEILMWDSVRDTLGITAKYLGYSWNTENDEQLEAIKNKLIEQKPLVQKYGGDEMKDQMIGGSAALTVMYSGEAYDAVQQNPDLDYVIPVEGSNKWVDAWTILKTSQKKDLAHAFIDFMLRPEIVVRNMEETGYTSAVKSAWDVFDDNHIMFPTHEQLARCETFLYSESGTRKYNDLWGDFRSR